MAEFPPDEELLDFDPTRYAELDRATADRLLVEEPVLYRNHLAIALWIEQWADRAEKDPAADLGEDFHEGQQVVFLHIICARAISSPATVYTSGSPTPNN
jgi:hypothetical protein